MVYYEYKNPIIRPLTAALQRQLLDDLVGQTRAHAGIALKVVPVLLRHLLVLQDHLGQLLQREVLDAVVQRRLGQREAVRERFDRAEEARQQPVLAHRLQDHVRYELALLVVDHDDAQRVGGGRIDALQPAEEVLERLDLGLGLDHLPLVERDREREEDR